MPSVLPFVKLDCGILNSTLWIDRLAREVFITALLMAEPRELTEPTPQIAITNLDLTGWAVPPGWYGFVPAAGNGILHRARVDEGEVGVAALVRLSDPDPESRSSAFEGRRMVRVNGGFIVLNFIAYREKDSTTADRSKRWRERQKLKAQLKTEALRALPTRVTDTPTRVIRHQAEAEAEAEAEVRSQIPVTTNKLVLEAGAVTTSTNGGNGSSSPAATHKPTTKTRSQGTTDGRGKHPVFVGQRFVVFDWQVEDLGRLLGSHLNDFELDMWFPALDASTFAAGEAVPQRDGGKWLQARCLEEAERRGIQIGSGTPKKKRGLSVQELTDAVRSDMKAAGEL